MAAEKLENDHVSKLNGVGNIPKPCFIGVAGGTASGKSTVCEKIMEKLGQNLVDQKERRVVTISLESFYKPLKIEDQTKASRGEYNFDHPNAFDFEKLLSTIKDLQENKIVSVSQWDFVNHQETGTSREIHPADVIMIEGILTFYNTDVRNQFHLKLFVDTDPDTRLSRRVMRDTEKFKRDIDYIIHQYTTYVKPAFEDFCLPTKKYADVIIPRGADNVVAIDLIVQHIQDLLKPHKKSNVRQRYNSDSLVSRPH